MLDLKRSSKLYEVVDVDILLMFFKEFLSKYFIKF